VACVTTLSPVNRPVTKGINEDEVVPLNVREWLRAVTVRTAGVISPVVFGT
jgi:hypothetical protein